jgi:hypothetical protein
MLRGKYKQIAPKCRLALFNNILRTFRFTSKLNKLEVKTAEDGSAARDSDVIVVLVTDRW